MDIGMVNEEMYLHAGAVSTTGLICPVPWPTTNALRAFKRVELQ